MGVSLQRRDLYFDIWLITDGGLKQDEKKKLLTLFLQLALEKPACVSLRFEQEHEHGTDVEDEELCPMTTDQLINICSVFISSTFSDNVVKLLDCHVEN